MTPGLPPWTKDLETPCLWLDLDCLDANIRRFEDRATALGVRLRPHLKTAKCVEIADRIPSARRNGITVSTLQEAEAFAQAGYRDIFYAVALAPSKVSRATSLVAQGVRLLLAVEDPQVLQMMLAGAEAAGVVLDLLIELDCGQHRCGLATTSAQLIPLARQIQESPWSRFQGIFTHAGHAYDVSTPELIPTIAAAEREALRQASERLQEAGIAPPLTSLGSTPTFAWVDHLEGVDEARPGVYLFQDIHQAALGSCSLDQIALTVLTTVIGKRPEANLLLVDAGGLALSKDRSTAGMGASDGGFGLVRDLDGQLIEGARITSVCQEHGFLQLPPHLSVDSFPAGTLFRILPNHACMTAAAHDSYRVVQGGALRDSWRRINFWHGCPSR